MQFGHSRCWIRNAQRKVVSMGTLVNNHYRLDCSKLKEQTSVAKEKTLELCHQRLGHMNEQMLKSTVQKGLVEGVTLQKSDSGLPFCEACTEGKMHRKPFKAVGEIWMSRKLELVHSNVCGPLSGGSARAVFSASVSLN